MQLSAAATPSITHCYMHMETTQYDYNYVLVYSDVLHSYVADHNR